MKNYRHRRTLVRFPVFQGQRNFLFLLPCHSWYNNYIYTSKTEAMTASLRSNSGLWSSIYQQPCWNKSNIPVNYSQGIGYSLPQSFSATSSVSLFRSLRSFYPLDPIKMLHPILFRLLSRICLEARWCFWFRRRSMTRIGAQRVFIERFYGATLIA